LEISVLICTYNRSDYLSGTIESCMNQEIDKNLFEVIVIDNNSTDGTQTLVNRYQNNHSNLRYVHESVQGLNRARTTGAKAARGKYIAYLDDDARAHPSWLAEILTAFKTQKPEPVCTGGKIHLDWEGMRPKWYPSEFDSLLTFVDHGDTGFYLKPGVPGHYILGTNMAFSRQMLLDLGGFPDHLDRCRGQLISGGDTEMVHRLFNADWPVFYTPNAIVYHVVVPDRRSKRFLIKRIRGDGATQPLLDLDREDFRNTNLHRRILYDAKEALKCLIKSFGYYVNGSQETGFIYFLYAVQKWGRTEMELKFYYDKEFAPLWRQRYQLFSG